MKKGRSCEGRSNQTSCAFPPRYVLSNHYLRFTKTQGTSSLGALASRSHGQQGGRHWQVINCCDRLFFSSSIYSCTSSHVERMGKKKRIPKSNPRAHCSKQPPSPPSVQSTIPRQQQRGQRLCTAGPRHFLRQGSLRERPAGLAIVLRRATAEPVHDSGRIWKGACAYASSYCQTIEPMTKKRGAWKREKSNCNDS